MLRLLHIENIAVIEQADILFERGFNVMTGETGAGKSIVIDAISAILGERAYRDMIRTGAARAAVRAIFDDVPELAWFAENSVPYDTEVVVQREIYLDGKNLCRVNGVAVTVGILRRLGLQLINIHGQHDGQQLLDEEQHQLYLDSFGKTEELLNTYTEKYQAFTEIHRQIRALQMDESEKARRVDTLRFQIEELQRAKLRPGEEEELSARRSFLRNGEKFISAVSEADYCLNGGDEGSGALGFLRQAQDAIGAVRHLDDGFAKIYERLEDIYSEVYDVAATVEDQRESFDFSPHELDDVESRLDRLYRLKKKYGPTVEDMLAYLEKCKSELEQIEYAGDALARLEKQEKKAGRAMLDAARALSARRHEAAQVLSAQILSELQQLDMGKIRFAVDFAEKAPDATGTDHIRFLMSANVGEELRPINRIASGGELARIMLAMKNVLSEQDHVGTLVFDEVDTGVSGRAAQRVAEKMARISRKKQVLCVTHLPQLAAMADTQFSVEKGEEGGRTFTHVCLLDRAQRRQELARLTGGARLTEAMLSGAEELLAGAEEFKKSL